MTTSRHSLTTETSNSKLTQLQQDIINNFQKSFPLCSSPYLVIAQKLDNHHDELSEQTVLTALSDLDSSGVTSRIGPVFDHK